MVEQVSGVWQFIAIAVTVLLAVLSVYGALILQNRNRVNTLWQRLLGQDSDETDDGFLYDTEDKLDEIETRMEIHSRQTHQQLYNLDRKMDSLVEALSDSDDLEVDLPEEVKEQEVPPPPKDIYTTDGGPDAPEDRDERGE